MVTSNLRVNKSVIHFLVRYSILTFLLYLICCQFDSNSTVTKESNLTDLGFLKHADQNPLAENQLDHVSKISFVERSGPTIDRTPSEEHSESMASNKSVAESFDKKPLIQEWFADCPECNNPLEQLLDPEADRPKLDMFQLYGNPRKEVLDDYCDTCAMVTNSGFLLGSKAGPEIDSKQCVFRMNDGRVSGYDEDVGGRTTYR